MMKTSYPILAAFLFTATFGYAVAPIITNPDGNASASLSVSENQTTVTDVDATDADGDPLSYSISGGADQALFDINSSTGVVVFLAAPNFENPTDGDTNNTYVVEVNASAAGDWDTQIITVTVLDANDAPVIAAPAFGTTVAVKEGNTYVVRIVGSDEDAGTVLSYEISGAAADDSNFTIDASGNLSFNSTPDYENPLDSNKDNVFQVEVVVRDATAEARLSVDVNVTNENDNPPVISTHDGNASITLMHNENELVVADVNATDADGDQLTFSIFIPADDANFSIDSNGTLRFVVPPDYEANGTDNNHTVTISVNDGLNSVQQTFTTLIVDLDEQPPQFTSFGGALQVSLSVDENEIFVADLNATDDKVPNPIFAIAGGLDSNSSIFDLNETTGILSFKSPPDFENPLDSNKDNVYQVILSASDVLSGSATQTLTITVNNKNEPPQVVQSSFIVHEDSPQQIELVATDPEGLADVFINLLINPSHGTLTGPTAGSSLQLTYAPNPDFNGPDQFIVSVGDGEFESNQTISISVKATLTLNKVGAGTVSGAGSYFAGETITVTATPDPGYRFMGWSGFFNSSSNSLEFKITGNMEINATFYQEAALQHVQNNPRSYNLYTEADLNASKKEGRDTLQADMARQGLSSVTFLNNISTKPYTHDWYYQPEWGWLWTNEDNFPFVYRAGIGETPGTWLYFSHNPEQSGVSFYDYSQAKWVSPTD